ncbi:unnamed protein product [Triticum turgidum subsp. durum]|uniref:Glycosyltransferases n=1 Tax=Triticum turgidum subsp. durum TaxID=4567 RepID=A0A9R0WE20_TRITD|nr:unnamed protein product [Triticum turgidum subsp. durum]
MGSAMDHVGAAGGRAKKASGGSQLWKKALLHSSLCFVMGFFTGFAPSSVSDWRSVSPAGVGSSHIVKTPQVIASGAAMDRSLLARDAAARIGGVPRPLLVVVTTTESTPTAAGERAAMLTRMALRDTGILYRHLTYKENFTAAEVAAGKERHHQRNTALEHIERHRLAAIVHFAGLGDVYELRFFDQLRQISTFGAWPVARMSRNERKVVIQGPACSSSKVLGWFSRDLMSNGTAGTGGGTAATSPEIDVHGFAFNSSVLWDPERWGRYPTSEPDKSQDSMRFVQQVVSEDYSKVKGIPPDCLEIMVWGVDTTPPTPTSSQQTPGNKRR